MERQALINFAVAHEKRLLDAALKALAEENRISTRHFLVSLLSCFSSCATPAFVLKSRTSPWFVARNLAIVLGQQGTPQVLAPLRALSRHTHPKVRREALRAEKKIQTAIAGREGDQGGKVFTALTLQDTREMEQSNAT
jgi:HEAT repeat protein